MNIYNLVDEEKNNENNKLELDFLIGPIVKDVFSVSQNKLITSVDSIDNNKSINELNEKISALREIGSFYFAYLDKLIINNTFLKNSHWIKIK